MVMPAVMRSADGLVRRDRSGLGAEHVAPCSRPRETHTFRRACAPRARLDLVEVGGMEVAQRAMAGWLNARSSGAAGRLGGAVLQTQIVYL